MPYIALELLQLILCIDGYTVPVIWHVISPVLFRILPYLLRDLLRKLNPHSLQEVPRDGISKMEVSTPGFLALLCASHFC